MRLKYTTMLRHDFCKIISSADGLHLHVGTAMFVGARNGDLYFWCDDKADGIQFSISDHSNSYPHIKLLFCHPIQVELNASAVLRRALPPLISRRRTLRRTKKILEELIRTACSPTRLDQI